MTRQEYCNCRDIYKAKIIDGNADSVSSLGKHLPRPKSTVDVITSLYKATPIPLYEYSASFLLIFSG